MLLARVLGTVVATRKNPTLEGIGLKVLQPCNERGEATGEPVVACDTVQCRPGDMVMWVAKREASLAIPGAALANFYPVDAAVTGLVDLVGDNRV
jgi:microcompartment protein CcmK/EutM